MANAVANQRLKVENGCISVWGVKKVESVTERQAVLVTDGKTTIKGVGISVSKLDLDAGSITLTYQMLESIAFGGERGKISLKGLLK